MLILVLATAAVAAHWLGAEPTQVRTVIWFCAIPLWFLAAYLAVVLLTPVTYALHRRYGPAVPLVLVAGVAAGDLARLADRDALATGSFLFGWVAMHQAGYAWRDRCARPLPPAPNRRTGRDDAGTPRTRAARTWLPATRRGALTLLFAGLAVLLALTLAGPYPISTINVVFGPVEWRGTRRSWRPPHGRPGEHAWAGGREMTDTSGARRGPGLVWPVLNGQLARAETFTFPSYSFDLATGVATFDYALGGPDGELRFTETVAFPLPIAQPDPQTLTTLGRVLELLHLVAGVSYYKAAAPRRLVAPAPLGAEAAALVTAVYTKGLAEYAYRNDLPHVLELTLERPDGDVTEPPRRDDSAGRPLSAVGGGKDSIVSLEALRRAGFDPVPFSVNPNAVIVAVNEASGLPALAARRRIDPALLDLNAAGARNGHVPVTAINSLIAVGTAVLHGLGPVVMSNERSASDPNLIWNGHEINHQWSKGLEAEGLLRAALGGHAGLVEPYFSLLRSLSELHIAKLFAQFDRYDDVVTSCNAAFKLRDATARWCGDCPKCRFVFLALAPFLSVNRLERIFGVNLLADPTQTAGFAALLGIDGHKPFECVGEVEESVVALSLLVERDQWRHAPVVRALRAALPDTAWAAASASDVFNPAGPHFVPPAYAKALAALT